MFGGMGPEKILLLAALVLLLFGAKRIPEIGSSFGKGIREFKKSIGDAGDATADRADVGAPIRDPDSPTRSATEETEWQPRRLGS
jgi:sec-independent protein translocase protein TatA